MFSAIIRDINKSYFPYDINKSHVLYDINKSANFPFSRGRICLYLYLKNNWNSNFTKLSTAEAKILTTSQKKMHKPSSFGNFTSPRPISLASGTGALTNFEDWVYENKDDWLSNNIEFQMTTKEVYRYTND